MTVVVTLGCKFLSLVFDVLISNEYFARLARKCLFTSLLGCFFAVEMGDNGHFLHFYPSRNAITGIDIVQNKPLKNRFCGLAWGRKQNFGSQK